MEQMKRLKKITLMKFLREHIEELVEEKKTFGDQVMCVRHLEVNMVLPYLRNLYEEVTNEYKELTSEDVAFSNLTPDKV